MKIHNTIKSTAVATGIAALVFTPTGLAQEAGWEGKKWDKPPVWEKLQEPLGLTADQVEELKTIGEAQRKAAQKLKQDTSLSKEEKREKLRALRAEGRKEVDSVLTAEQRQKMRELRQQRREKMRQMCEEKKQQCQWADGR